MKPKLVVEQWLALFGEQIEIRETQAASLEELSRAHQPSYVEGVLSCQDYNGFGNRERAIADSLPWTSGSFLSATRHVLVEGGAAVSPTSGFHHAGYNFGGGFCTFNGLMVAALAARDSVERVGILDCDIHYGNGTDHIIDRLELDFISHLTQSSGYSWPEPDQFVDELAERLTESKIGLLLYQAGADPHIDDPLGGWMSTEQMRRRDRAVFEWCKSAGVPVVWNLAGGYQEDIQRVLDLHHQTMEECLRVFGGSVSP